MLGSRFAALPEPVCHSAEHLLAGTQAALSLSVEVSSHVQIIHRLQGKKKTNHFALVQWPDGTRCGEDLGLQ